MTEHGVQMLRRGLQHTSTIRFLLTVIGTWYHAQDWKLEITDPKSPACVLHSPGDFPYGWLDVNERCSGCGAGIPHPLWLQFRLLHPGRIGYGWAW